MKKPKPINEEVVFDDNELIISKTDIKGRILYGNEVFISISGYDEQELLGRPHNILRHPDMPRAIFKLLWDTISQGKELFAYIKNLRKDGKFYWVYAQVTPTFDRNGHIVGYHSVRRKPNKHAVSTMEELYRSMLISEKNGGMEAGTKILTNLLKQKGLDYEKFIFTL